jgi:hypothetical protein
MALTIYHHSSTPHSGEGWLTLYSTVVMQPLASHGYPLHNSIFKKHESGYYLAFSVKRPKS